MSKYESQKTVANIPVETAFERLTNLNALSEKMDNLPEEQRENLKSFHFEDDSISISSPMGEIKFVRTTIEEPTQIEYSAKDSPIDIKVRILLEPNGEESNVTMVIDADIPFFLRGMIGGKLQEAVNMLGAGIAKAISNRENNDEVTD